MLPKCTSALSMQRAIKLLMFPSSLCQNRVYRPWLPVGFPLFGNQLQEMGMAGIEEEGRVNVDPLDLSRVIASLQRQLAHAVTCSNNKYILLLYRNAICCPQRKKMT